MAGRWADLTQRFGSGLMVAVVGVVEVDDLVTGRFDLADGEQALRAGLDDPASVKAMIYPNGLPTV